MALHGYREVRTPLVEPTARYVRAVGETTDMVEKEMYSFSRSPVISVSHLILRFSGPSATQRDLRSSSTVTVSRRFMKRGRFSKSRQKRYASCGVQLMSSEVQVEDWEGRDF